ncbi:MAG: GGDEF domain-containing protein [Gaiella sp.]
MADPSRGTVVAVAFPLAAIALILAIELRRGFEVAGAPALVLALLVAATVSERLAIQFGPRSRYTASTPSIVLAGLVGGPLIGFATGAATQVASGDTVWRRRAAEGGVGALQGIAAGCVGLLAWSGATGAVVVVLGAYAASIAVNTMCRALVMLERRTRPFAQTWARGIAVDGVEAVVLAPLLATLLFVSDVSPALVVGVVASLVLGLLLVERLRSAAASALATEQENARRDQLTGAPNRRAFEEALALEHARVVRGGQPAGLFVIDIDRFKAINDRHGHSVGDDVLIGVVERLVEGLRSVDLVARWGGEEITVLAPGVRSRRGLEQFGERIRRLVGDVPLTVGHTALPVTVSVGGTLLDGSQQPGEAIRRADGAMYEAKRRRDSWVVTLPPRLTLHLESA